MICPVCYEPIVSNIGTVSQIQEGVAGYMVWHIKCAPFVLQGLSNENITGAGISKEGDSNE